VAEWKSINEVSGLNHDKMNIKKKKMIRVFARGYGLDPERARCIPEKEFRQKERQHWL
jgi:hypothetical protein